MTLTHGTKGAAVVGSSVSQLFFVLGGCYNVRRQGRDTLRNLPLWRFGDETQTFPLRFELLPRQSVHNSWTDVGVIRRGHTSSCPSPTVWHHAASLPFVSPLFTPVVCPPHCPHPFSHLFSSQFHQFCVSCPFLGVSTHSALRSFSIPNEVI